MAIVYGTNIEVNKVPSLDLRFADRKSLVDTISGKNLIDFSRVQSGTSKSTYFGADGLLKYADANEPRFDHDPTTGESLGLLVEEARTNSQTYSTHLVSSSWVTSNTTAIPNAALSPDGTFTAIRLVENTSNTVHTYSMNYATETTSSLTLFAKEGLRRYLHLAVSGDVGYNTYSIIVDLRTGSINDPKFFNGTPTASSTATLCPNGWIKITVSSNKSRYWKASISTASVHTNFDTDYGLETYTGDGVSDLYLWGIQYEAGSFPTSYIPTPATFTSRSTTATYYDANGVIQTAGIDVARDDAYFPDENGVMRPAGLLLEAQGTNLLTYSSDLATNWLTIAATKTATAATAPNGALEAVKLTPDATVASHYVYQTVSTGGAYTFSAYIKPAGYSVVSLYAGGASYARFNLSTESVLGENVFSLSKIEKLTNGWFRVSAFIDNTGVSTQYHIYAWDDTDFGNYAGDGTSGIYVWGAQLEASTYPTSYIPTDGTPGGITRAADVSSSSTVTRSADVAQITGSNFSSWFNSNQGTFFTDCNSVSLQSAISSLAYNSAHTGAFALGTGAPGAGRMYAQLYSVLSNNTIAVNIFQYNGWGTDFGPSIVNVIPFGTDVQKVAFYSDPPSELYAISTANNLNTLNTNLGKTGDYSYTFADMMRIGYNSDYYGNFNGTISRLTYYPQRLQDSTLQKLTR